MATVVESSIQPFTRFILETTHRESGDVQRQEFATSEERINAFSRIDIHAHGYRFEETGEAA